MINLQKPIIPVLLQIPDSSTKEDWNMYRSSDPDRVQEKLNLFNDQMGTSVRIIEKDRMPGEESDSELGSGGFATVFLGEDVERFPDRKLAIKNIDVNRAEKNFCTTDRVEKMLSREVVLMNEPGIFRRYLPTIHDVWDIRHEGKLISRLIVMDQYQPISTIFASEGELSSDGIIKITYDLLCVLSNLHKNNVFHRDIKPENVMVNAQVTPVQCIFIDFNVARKGYAAHISKSTRISNPHHAPEFTEQENFTPEMEIYSLGSVLYYYITGHIPSEFFIKENSEGWSSVVQTLKTPNNKQKFSEEYLDIIIKAIEHYPEDRYQKADEMLQALKNTKVFRDYVNKLPYGLFIMEADKRYGLYKEADAARQGLPLIKDYEESIRKSPYYDKARYFIQNKLDPIIFYDRLDGKGLDELKNKTRRTLTLQQEKMFKDAADDHSVFLLKEIYIPLAEINKNGVQLFDRTGLPDYTIWDAYGNADYFWDCAIYHKEQQIYHGLPADNNMLEAFLENLACGAITITGYDIHRGERFVEAAFTEDVIRLYEKSDGDVFPEDDLWAISSKDKQRRDFHACIAEVFKDPVQVSARIQDYLYANDHCPCGSGKKFKDCCGKMTVTKNKEYFRRVADLLRHKSIPTDGSGFDTTREYDCTELIPQYWTLKKQHYDDDFNFHIRLYNTGRLFHVLIINGKENFRESDYCPGSVRRDVESVKKYLKQHGLNNDI